MFATDFEFAGKRLSDYNCIICVINGNTGVQEVEIGCDLTFNTVKNNHTFKRNIASSTYDNVCSMQFQITKNFCKSKNIYMTPLEAESLVKWLNRRNYSKFKLYNPSNIELNVCYFGTFKNVKMIKNGEQIIGLSLIFEANTPYAFGEEINLEYDLDETESCIFATGDEFGVIYPCIKIKCKADGDLKLTMKNSSDENYIYISDCLRGEIITLDGEHRIITSDKRESTDIANKFNYEYFEMLVDDDNSENHYSSTLPCRININYRPVKKVVVM